MKYKGYELKLWNKDIRPYDYTIYIGGLILAGSMKWCKDTIDRYLRETGRITNGKA